MKKLNLFGDNKEDNKEDVITCGTPPCDSSTVGVGVTMSPSDVKTEKIEELIIKYSKVFNTDWQTESLINRKSALEDFRYILDNVGYIQTDVSDGISHMQSSMTILCKLFSMLDRITLGEATLAFQIENAYEKGFDHLIEFSREDLKKYLEVTNRHCNVFIRGDLMKLMQQPYIRSLVSNDSATLQVILTRFMNTCLSYIDLPTLSVAVELAIRHYKKDSEDDFQSDIILINIINMTCRISTLLKNDIDICEWNEIMSKLINNLSDLGDKPKLRYIIDNVMKNNVYLKLDYNNVSALIKYKKDDTVDQVRLTVAFLGLYVREDFVDDDECEEVNESLGLILDLIYETPTLFNNIYVSNELIEFLVHKCCNSLTSIDSLKITMITRLVQMIRRDDSFFYTIIAGIKERYGITITSDGVLLYPSEGKVIGITCHHQIPTDLVEHISAISTIDLFAKGILRDYSLIESNRCVYYAEPFVRYVSTCYDMSLAMKTDLIKLLDSFNDETIYSIVKLAKNNKAGNGCGAREVINIASLSVLDIACSYTSPELLVKVLPERYVKIIEDVYKE